MNDVNLKQIFELSKHENKEVVVGWINEDPDDGEMEFDPYERYFISRDENTDKYYPDGENYIVYKLVSSASVLQILVERK